VNGVSHLKNSSHSAFRYWVLGAGVFNLISCSLLAIPFLYAYQYRMLNAVNRVLGLGGDPLVLPREGVNMLFVNTAGLILCSVGLMLIYAARDLKNRSGIPCVNALTRIVWAALIFYYVLTENLAHILITFAVTDLIFAAVILYYVSRMRRDLA
jgi:hypothetical protein